MMPQGVTAALADPGGEDRWSLTGDSKRSVRFKGGVQVAVATVVIIVAQTMRYGAAGPRLGVQCCARLVRAG
jgi:hypothetical protein